MPRNPCWSSFHALHACTTKHTGMLAEGQTPCDRVGGRSAENSREREGEIENARDRETQRQRENERGGERERILSGHALSAPSSATLVSSAFGSFRAVQDRTRNASASKPSAACPILGHIVRAATMRPNLHGGRVKVRIGDASGRKRNRRGC